MLVGEIEVKLQKLKQQKNYPKLDLKTLQEEVEVKAKFTTEIRTKLETTNTTQCAKELVKIFQSNIKEAAKKSIPNCSKKKHKPWITQEILELMNKRRKLKRNSKMYKQLDREIRNACQKAKEMMYNNQCQEIEELEKKNSQLMHTKIKETTNKYKTCSSASCIEAKDGTIIMEKGPILERWKEYIGELFEDNRPPEFLNNKKENESLPILKEEVTKAIRSMPNKKAAGPDEVSIELIQALDELGAEWMTMIANKIYDEGYFPIEMSRSVFIALPKKAGTTKCELHRTISLMSHMTKVILKILLQRIRGRTKGEISEEQFGFMPDKGTRNAIFTLRMISERCIEMQKDVYICFIDYAKAFDKVQHEQLFNILQGLDINNKDIELLKNLYWEQQAAVRIGQEMSDWINIKRGVRQGCVLSPELFSLYTEMIMRKIKHMDGVKIGGFNINNIRYADDTAIITDSEQKLQTLMNKLVKESRNFGLEINRSKTFSMVISKKSQNPKCKIKIDGTQIKQVEKFEYLGSLITSDGKSDKEIKRRIGIAKTVFKSMSKVVSTRNINNKTKLRLIKCYIWSTMMYGCETWTISEAMKKQLEATEMWTLRRMLKISWIRMMKNDDILRRAGTERQLMKSIVQRQCSFLGHVLRRRGIEHQVVTGKVEGKRERGRQRLTFLEWLSKCLGKKRVEIIRLVENKTKKTNCSMQ